MIDWLLTAPSPAAELVIIVLASLFGVGLWWVSGLMCETSWQIVLGEKQARLTFPWSPDKRELNIGPEATDILYDTSPATLALIFGRRTRDFVYSDAVPDAVYEQAVVAAHFARQAYPLLIESTPERQSQGAKCAHGGWREETR